MTLLEQCQWLEALPLAQQVRESEWLFPWLSILHVTGLALAGGSIAYLDLRLLGIGLRRTPVSQVAASLLKWMWVGWVLMLVSGSLIFISEATMLYSSVFFRAKLFMMMLAGVNALVFHYTVFRRVGEWELATPAPLQARVTGAISLTLWMGMIAAGRLIPYYAS
jgi:hypothetical protein